MSTERIAHNLRCYECDRNLVDVTSFNARQVAVQCKCGAKHNAYPNQVGALEFKVKRNPISPAWLSEQDDLTILRETSTLLRDKRERVALLEAQIDLIAPIREEAAARQRDTLIRAAMADRLASASGGVKDALRNLLAQLDEDSRAEFLAEFTK